MQNKCSSVQDARIRGAWARRHNDLHSYFSAYICVHLVVHSGARRPVFAPVHTHRLSPTMNLLKPKHNLCVRLRNCITPAPHPQPPPSHSFVACTLTRIHTRTNSHTDIYLHKNMLTNIRIAHSTSTSAPHTQEMCVCVRAAMNVQRARLASSCGSRESGAERTRIDVPHKYAVFSVPRIKMWVIKYNNTNRCIVCAGVCALYVSVRLAQVNFSRFCQECSSSSAQEDETVLVCCLLLLPARACICVFRSHKVDNVPCERVHTRVIRALSLPLCVHKHVQTILAHILLSSKFCAGCAWPSHTHTQKNCRIESTWQKIL